MKFNKEESSLLSEINMTPFVDVMLVLLVIFLITAPMMNNAIKLKLPQESAQMIDEKKAINISIDASGKYYFEDQLVLEEFLEKHLCSIVKEEPEQKIRLQIDKKISYGEVSHVMAVIQKCGISNLEFITQAK
jgi:biopolymer transport protein ExbD